MSPSKILSLLMLSSPICAAAQPLTPAFPGAQGFGALATGGRGGTVYRVTNLADSGPGSLRDAVSGEKRIVVFDVAGVIEIKTPLIFSSHLTVAGQSAPAPGITIYGDSCSFGGREDIIVRHIRMRQGIESGRGAKALNITTGSNMIFDHVSASWGRWDTMGITVKSSKITMQHCLFAEAIDPQRFGGLIDSSTDITMIGNLWMNNQSRSPKIKAHMQYMNNVIYNWGVSGVPGGHSAAVWNQDVVNNLFIKGPASNDKVFDMFASTDHVYQRGNLADLDKDGVLGGKLIVEADFYGATPPTFRTAPFNKPEIPVTILSVEAAYQKILSGVGTSIVRDSTDLRVLDQLKSLGTKGAIIRSEAEVGGQPAVVPVFRPATFDSDQDGISDVWERANGLNPADASDTMRETGGIAHIERYLNSLAP